MVANRSGITIHFPSGTFTCRLCDRSFASENALLAHCSTSLQHVWCSPCKRLFRTANALKAHDVAVHNMCDVSGCGRFFQNENNLHMHKISHKPKNHECAGCTARFATQAAMMLHLEIGNCASGVDRDDIDRWAQKSGTAGDFFNYDYNYSCSYRCPDCESTFQHVSGLLQHTESRAMCCRYGTAYHMELQYMANEILDGVEGLEPDSSEDLVW